MKTVQPSGERHWYFDLINIIACFCVVAMHCNSRINMYGTGLGWNLSVVIHCLCIWAVTAFFMMSGANLLEYRQKYSTKDFIKKRVLKIVIPFLIWSFIYAVWKQYTGQIDIPSVVDGIRMFFRNEYNAIFWFFYTLIPAYFCIPILSLITTQKSRKLGWYLFFLGLCNLSIFPLFQTFLGMDLSLLRFPIGYSPVCLLILGWLLKRGEITSVVRKLVYVGAVASLIITYWGTCCLSAANGVYDKTILTSGSVFSICIASALFLFFKNRRWGVIDKGWFKNILRNLSSVSLGVYFVQIIVLYYYRKLEFVDPYSIYSSVFGAIAVYVVSVCVVLVVKKIPGLKILAP